MNQVERLSVALDERRYDILIGEDLIARAGEHMAPLAQAAGGGRRVMIVTDETVAGLHLGTLERALAGAGIAAEAFVVPPGEASKDFATLQHLCERLLEAGLDRRSLLVALGGGVVGDLTGFAAAILLRGIDFVQIPTTLLAQVDSSVGGKTGIDTPQGKNLVGAFHQPRLVLADTGALASLPRREMLAGYAEVAKYGLLGDAGFFHWLQGHGHAVVEGEPNALRQAVLTSCRAKAAVVAADEREAGQRALLNLGHTFAHALEIECGFGQDLLHGEAVAIGMTLAFELSAQLGHCPPEDADAVRRHLAAVDLPTGFGRLGGRAWTAERLIEHMRKDKKASGGRLTFVLARRIGEAFVSRDVDEAEVAHLLTEAITQTAPPLDLAGE